MDSMQTKKEDAAYDKKPEVVLARRQYLSGWRKQNREKLKKAQKDYHARNRTKINADRKKRFDENPGRYREYHWEEQGIKMSNGLTLTYEKYLSMLNQQGYMCPVCGDKLTNKNGHPDHDHKTGLVRGILCKKCNCALGLLGDDLMIVTKATEYLKRYWNVAITAD